MRGASGRAKEDGRARMQHRRMPLSRSRTVSVRAGGGAQPASARRTAAAAG